MKRSRAWSLVLTAWSAAFLLAACGRPPGDQVVIPKTTKVLDEAGLAALVSVADDVLRFSATTTQLAGLAPGDVIVASVGPVTPYGLLRTVTATQLAGDEVVVRTVPASLEDAIDQATITLRRALTRNDLLAGAMSGIGFEEPATGLAIGFDDVPLNDAETVRASGSLIIEPTIDLTIRLGLTTGLEEVSFAFGATQGASLEIVGDDAATFDKETTIGTPLVFTPIVVDVGGVPVVFTPIVTFVVGGSGEATGSFAGSVRQQAEYSLGLAYEGGTVDATQSREIAAHGDPPRISSSANAMVYTGPRLEVLVYGIVGPHVAVEAYAQANARLDGPPTCLQWDLVAGLKGLVGFEFLLDYEDEVIDTNESIAERSDCTDGDPTSTWSRTYASDAQSVHSVQRTDEAGFVTAGYHMDPTRNEPFGISVMRLDERGAVVWQRALSYAVTGYPSAIRQALGGGYLVASGGWATGSSNEAVLTRLDPDGNLLWAKTYDSNDGRPLWPQAIANHIDGSITVAGAHGWSYDSGDVWVASFAEDGTPLWSRTFGEAGWDLANDLLIEADGSHVIAATTNTGGSGGDLWVLHLDRDGGLVRQRAYGGAPIGGFGFGSTAVRIERVGSGYVLLGEVGGAAFDTIVVQIGEDGALEETAAFDAHSSASGFDDVTDLLLTQDGGIVIAGTNDSELWLLKTGGDGSWHKAYAVSTDSLQDRPYFSGDYLTETADGSLVVAGSMGPCPGSLACRAWLMQLTNTGAITFDPTSGAYAANANATIYGPDLFERSTAAGVLEVPLTVQDVTAEVAVFVTDVVEELQAP